MVLNTKPLSLNVYCVVGSFYYSDLMATHITSESSTFCRSIVFESDWRLCSSLCSSALARFPVCHLGSMRSGCSALFLRIVCEAIERAETNLVICTSEMN